jgi:hypothetical protein
MPSLTFKKKLLRNEIVSTEGFSVLFRNTGRETVVLTFRQMGRDITFPGQRYTDGFVIELDDIPAREGEKSEIARRVKAALESQGHTVDVLTLDQRLLDNPNIRN